MIPRPILFAGLAVILCMSLSACGSGTKGTLATRVVVLGAGQAVPATASAATATANITIPADVKSVTVSVQTTGLVGVTKISICGGLSGTVGLIGQTAPEIFTVYDRAVDGAFAGTITKTLFTADFLPQPAVGLDTFVRGLNSILSGRAYMVVLTDANPVNGEIRGQILPVEFDVTMTPSAVVPAVSNSGIGNAKAIMDITAGTVKIDGTLTGLAGVNGITMNYGGIGTTGSVLNVLYAPADYTFTGSFSKTVTAATFTPLPADGINTFTDLLNAIILSKVYVQASTTGQTTGAARGQIGYPN